MADNKAHLVKMTKDGDTIEVHPSTVASHHEAGWSVAEGGLDGVHVDATEDEGAALRLQAETHAAAFKDAQSQVATLQADVSAIRARLAEAEAEAKRQSEAKGKAVADAVKRATEGHRQEVEQLRKERDDAVKAAKAS